jgi:peptidoglycan hydrolase-like protein with peptidoglycan-binding domain
VTRRAKLAAGGVVAAVAVGAAVALAGGGGQDSSAAETTAATDTAVVERRDLVERETLSGTLGYDGERTIGGQGQGTLTRLPAEGAVKGRGEPLYEVDGEPTAYVMYGARPAWRRLDSRSADGPDIRQLERNLERLGYDSGTVDDDWTSDTTAAVKAWEDDRGATEDGAVELGEVVFLPGRSRVGERLGEVGTPLRPGAELMKVSSLRRIVTVDLEADRQTLVHRGDKVLVDLPDGRSATGRISSVGRVATSSGDDGGGDSGGDGSGQDSTPTIEVKIALGKRARSGSLDQAPVDVEVESRSAENVLAVPVAALLAREGGGYALEVVGSAGRRRLVRVETGLFADGLVEVNGGGLREGMRVAVASE